MDSSNHIMGGSVRTGFLRQLHVYCKIKQINNGVDVFEDWEFW